MPLGDVVAQVLVAAGVRERVQDAVVLGGCPQFQAAGQVVHGGAVLEQVPVQQHLPVVAVMGGHLLDLLVLPLEPAEVVHRRSRCSQGAGLYAQGLRHRVQRGCEPLAEPVRDGVRPGILTELPDHRQDLGSQRGRLLPRGLHGTVGVDVLEHRTVVPDQRLDDGLLLIPDLLQLRLGPLDLQRDPLAEHRGQVVPGPHPCLVDQAHQQREPLHQVVVPQPRRICGIRLTGEIRDLPRGDASQPQPGLAQLVHPPQMLGLGTEVRPRRGLRRLLQPVVLRGARGVLLRQQRKQPLAVGLAELVVDAHAD